MDFMETVKNRYSCKKFDGRPVPQDKLDAILEAGRLAPTAKNLQEQHIYECIGFFRTTMHSVRNLLTTNLIFNLKGCFICENHKQRKNRQNISH